MTNWNETPYVTRRLWVLALCGTLLTGCSTGDITLPGINQDPTADAGVDLTTDVGQRVTLNGLGSTDADDDPLTFSWQQRSGPPVTLDGPNTVQPSFVPIEDGFYEFALTVTDGRGGSDISVVRVFVGNVDPATCPRADAGTDQTVNEGAAVRLRGGNSADPGGRPLTFEWFQLSGPQVSINGVFIVEPSFAAPQATGAEIELEFELTVTNEQGCPDRDTVVITVRDRDSGDPCNGVVCDDDRQFCNGVEICESGACVSSNAPCGTGETCDESTESCDAATACTTDSDCDDDIYCNGQEMCVSGACLDGTEPCSAGDTCNEGTDSCDSATACTTDSNCDDGVYCNGEEECVSGGCVAGTEPCLAGETCDEQDDTCTPTDPDDAPLGLVVVTSPNPARRGETLDIELTVTNPGNSERTGVVLTLDYPDGLNGLSNSLFDGFCPGSSCGRQERATFNIGTLAAGEGRTFSMPIQVASDTADGTIIDFNAMVVDVLGSQVLGTDSIMVDATRKLELALVENVDPVPTDGVLVYTLNYGLLTTDNGIDDAILSMPLPDGTSYLSANEDGMLVQNGNVIQWSLGAIGPGQSGEVQATVQVENLIEGSIIEAEATLKDIQTPANHVRSQAATRVQNNIPLELAVVTSLDRVLPGGSLDVEFTVTNTGGFARNDVVLTLEYPDRLNGLSNSLFDGFCPGSSCGRQERATFNIGTLASGGQIVFRMPLIVATGTLEGRLIRFDALVFDNAGSQVIDTAVLKVGN
ncbi:MAG: DUF11 domain-containing protein [Planctomycetes bacterium]|nr:DUF11 domain-containing protein [Planctomycetota bacterium]